MPVTVIIYGNTDKNNPTLVVQDTWKLVLFGYLPIFSLPIAGTWQKDISKDGKGESLSGGTCTKVVALLSQKRRTHDLTEKCVYLWGALLIPLSKVSWGFIHCQNFREMRAPKSGGGWGINPQVKFIARKHDEFGITLALLSKAHQKNGNTLPSL